MAGLISEHPVI